MFWLLRFLISYCVTQYFSLPSPSRASDTQVTHPDNSNSWDELSFLGTIIPFKFSFPHINGILLYSTEFLNQNFRTLREHFEADFSLSTRLIRTQSAWSQHHMFLYAGVYCITWLKTKYIDVLPENVRDLLLKPPFQNRIRQKCP